MYVRIKNLSLFIFILFYIIYRYAFNIIISYVIYFINFINNYCLHIIVDNYRNNNNIRYN